jgi:glycosyltransferase involved in cell wall biosynthesis
MRLLILVQHYAPEITAARFRLEAFARGLTRRGHEVQVICPVPNHPRGVIEAGYRRGLVVRREVAGSRVTYLRVFTSREKTVWKRLAYYGTYAGSAALAGAVARRPDVVLASSPPLSVATVGTLVAARHRAPLLLDVRDVWPQSALDVGELKPGALFSAAEAVEHFAYRRADLIVTANDAFRRWIEERAPDGASIEVVENGTTEELLRIGESTVDRASVGLPEGVFVWAYAGNIGLAHGLEFAADAAGVLGEEYVLVVVGEGPRRAALEQRIADQPLGSVQLQGLMTAIDAARRLRAADAVLVSERQERTVSAKLYDVCAMGRPIVAACRGELRRIVEREEIGLAVPHGDPQALADAVRRLRSDPELRERMGERARAFARLHLRVRQADRLADLAESLDDRG